MNNDKSQKEIAEGCLKKAREQMEEYEKTKNKNLLNYAYSNIGFAIYSKLDATNEIQKLKSYGIDVSKIKEWKLNVKDGKIIVSEDTFGLKKS